MFDDRPGRLLAMEKPLGMFALVPEAHHHQQIAARGEGQRAEWRLSHGQPEHGASLPRRYLRLKWLPAQPEAVATANL